VSTVGWDGGKPPYREVVPTPTASHTGWGQWERWGGTVGKVPTGAVVAVATDATPSGKELVPLSCPLSPARGQALSGRPRAAVRHSPPVIRVLWTAGPDGIAHAHVGNRTACHVSPIAERYAWPTLSRCPACLRVVADDGR
jgi:hypothetical protein